MAAQVPSQVVAEMTAKMHKMPLGTKTESRLWSYMRLLLGLCPDGPEAFAEAIACNSARWECCSSAVSWFAFCSVATKYAC